MPHLKKFGLVLAILLVQGSNCMNFNYGDIVDKDIEAGKDATGKWFFQLLGKNDSGARF